MGQGKGKVNWDASPNEIRRQIEQTRRRIDATLAELESRFQAKGLVGKAEAILGDEFRRNRIMQTVRDNPVPAVMSAMALAGAAAGVAYLAAEGPDGKHSYEYEGQYGAGLEYEGYETAGSGGGIGDTVKDKARQAGDAARSAGQAVSGAARQAGHSAASGYEQAKEKVSETLQSAGGKLKETYEQHPLAAGAAALAAGVLLGELLPSTQAEDKLMGQTSDKLTDKAKQTGESLAHKATETAKAAVEAGADEADRQGMSPRDLGEKAKAVGQAAVDAGKGKARQEGLTPEQLKESARQR